MRHISRFAYFLFALVLFTHCTGNRPDAKPLEQIVADINAKCPQMIDSETRIDGIEIKANNVLAYKYTLINLSAANVDTSEFRKALWPGLLAIIRTNPELQELRNRQTVFEYNYLDKQKQFVYSFKILPRDYTP
jgi:hypothetical protein